MKVELVFDPTKKSFASRVKAPIKKVSANRPTKVKPKPAPVATATATGATAGGKSKRARRPKKTVAELDAEMTDYFQENNAEATV